MIRTVKGQNQVQFEIEVNGLLEKGFTLSSSCCNTFQFAGYPEETYWTAILTKPITNKETE